MRFGTGKGDITRLGQAGLARAGLVQAGVAGRLALRHTLDRAGQRPPTAGDATRLRRPGAPVRGGGGPLDRRVMMAWLKRAIRAERGRGVRGDWAYDVNRHIALIQTLRGLEMEDHAASGKARNKKRRGE